MGMMLSKTALGKFKNCPRCFWLKYRFKLDQPEMISSKVWKGIERITQAHYEEARVQQFTPAHLIGQVPDGCIPYQGDRIELRALRYWGKGLRFNVDGVEVSTALDDMLQRTIVGKILYNVIDYKSKSKLTDEKATRELYEEQADVFDLACNENGYPTDGIVYFDYWSPQAVKSSYGRGPDSETGVTSQAWLSQVIKLQADHERVRALIRAAAACLESVMPDPSPKCPVCSYVAEREELFKKLKTAA
jgi:hypothetical protein